MTYLIIEQEYLSDIEEWEFRPGQIVKCEEKKMQDGEFLVATKLD